eukprot:Gb_27525 [translate_table: standard]
MTMEMTGNTEDLNSVYLDDDDEELDRELEEVAATFSNRPLFELPSASSSNPNCNLETPPSSSEARLTFQFPGWGIDICRDAKRKGAAITRHPGMPCLDSPLTNSQLRDDLQVKKSFGEAEKPGIGTCVYGMPNEVWIRILRQLNVRDICSVMQTCRWLYNLAIQDDVWVNFACHIEDSDGSSFRWIDIKRDILRTQMKQRFSYLSKCYDYLRSALNPWWDAGGPDDHYSSKSLHSLIRKMTARDWTIVYEAFAVVFSERADRLAGLLLTHFGCSAAHDVDIFFSKKDKSVRCQWLCLEDLTTSRRKPLSSTWATSHLSSDGICANINESQYGLIGKEMWQLVQTSWKRYKHWLMLVSTHCQDLNYEVMVERARSIAWSSTPTVYDKGVICFRNQILLRYKIRNALQCGLSWLIGQDAQGFASEKDVQLLRAVLHLLQEVDVADDFTLSSKTYTRAKLKRCFLLNGVTSKVLH